MVAVPAPLNKLCLVVENTQLEGSLVFRDNQLDGIFCMLKIEVPKNYLLIYSYNTDYYNPDSY